MQIHSLKNLGTNDNVTGKPLFVFVSHGELRDSILFKRLSTSTPSKYYTDWKHLGSFKYISIYKFVCML